MDSKQIRQQFISFFKDKEHKIVPSAPIVLQNDPTLMFTNAGMNQFKDYFLGTKNPTEVRVAGILGIFNPNCEGVTPRGRGTGDDGKARKTGNKKPETAGQYFLADPPRS